MSFTGKIGTDWTGQYSRWIYDEAKSYLMVAKMRLEPTTLGSIPLLDVELNAQAEILLQLLRRSITRIYGSGTSGNGFKITQSAISTTNNFTIMGGDGTAAGAGVIFVEGWMPVNLSGIEYTAQAGSAELTTPVADRTDEVYIDVYYKEITAAVDSDLIDPVSALETSRRIALVWEVKVAEGAVTPVNYTDANNVFHWTMKLSTLSRLAGNAAILTAMIADDRNLNRVVSLASELTAHAAVTDAHSATNTPTAAHIPLYDAGARLKANTPVATNDVARKAEIDTVTGDISAHAALTNAHGASATPATDKIAMYDEGGRLQANTPVVAADVARKTETDALATADSVHAALTNPHSATSAPTASRIAMWDSSGDLIARMMRMTYTSTAQGAYFVGMADLGASNNYLRPMTIAQAQAALGYVTSLAQNGYQKLPGGLILQWGKLTGSPSGIQTITFPITYPSAAYIVLVTDVSDDTSGGLGASTTIYTDSLGQSQFQVSRAASTTAMYWLAFGR
ncbi:MAG: hypothetical protein WC114_11075 [Smithellaceae bacterium]